MTSWKEVLHSLAIQPIQQFRYTKGKNSTDSALIIDAMDLLHSGTAGGFCIVSSDSDYTRLATRVREQGLSVMGVGREDTPEGFVKRVRSSDGPGWSGRASRSAEQGRVCAPKLWLLGLLNVLAERHGARQDAVGGNRSVLADTNAHGIGVRIHHLHYALKLVSQ